MKIKKVRRREKLGEESEEKKNVHDPLTMNDLDWRVANRAHKRPASSVFKERKKSERQKVSDRERERKRESLNIDGNNVHTDERGGINLISGDVSLFPQLFYSMFNVHVGNRHRDHYRDYTGDDH